MKINLKAKETQAIHTALSQTLEGDAQVSTWSKIFDTVKVLEEVLTTISSKEKALRQKVLKDFVDKETGEVPKEKEQEANQELIKHLNDFLNEEYELEFKRVITFEEIENIDNLKLQGRSLLNIKFFCDMLQEDKNKEE